MRFFGVVIFVLSVTLSQAQPLTVDEQIVVKSFVDIIKKREVNSLAKIMSFPFRREQPFSDIKDSMDLVTRYNEVFDDSLSALIINSSLVNDWSSVGWRGIMLHNGLLWLDYDGKLIRVNYQSPAEQSRKKVLETAERDSLHSSSSTYIKNHIKLETDSFKIRIDEIGISEFRYVAWHADSSTTSLPMEVIEGGKIFIEGSGGNYRLEFKNGTITYEIEVIVMGEDGSPPARLNIYENEKTIISHNAIIVRN